MPQPVHHYHKPPTKRQRKRISKYLSPSEEVILVTTVGSRYLWLNLIFLLLVPLALFYLSIFMFVGLVEIPNYDWLKYLGILGILVIILKIKSVSNILRKRQANVYVLTTTRILIITGLFSRKIVTAPLDRITHITVDQSFIQRLLYNTGHLLIITAGFDQREIVVEHVAYPVKFKILVEETSVNPKGQPAGKNIPEEKTKLREISV